MKSLFRLLNKFRIESDYMWSLFSRINLFSGIDRVYSGLRYSLFNGIDPIYPEGIERFYSKEESHLFSRINWLIQRKAARFIQWNSRTFVSASL